MSAGDNAAGPQGRQLPIAEPLLELDGVSRVYGKEVEIYACATSRFR